MTPIVKICGLSTATTLEAALQAGADVVGFVFFAKSPRHLGFEAARALGAQARGRARIVSAQRRRRRRRARAHRRGARTRDPSVARPRNSGAGSGDRPALCVLDDEGDRRRGAGRSRRRRALRRRGGLLASRRQTADRAPCCPAATALPFDWRLASGFSPQAPWLLSGGPRSRQCRASDRADGRARRRCLVGGRERAGRSRTGT